MGESLASAWHAGRARGDARWWWHRQLKRPFFVLQVARLIAPAAERRLRPEVAIASLLAAAPAGSRVERLILESAGHAQGMADEPERYWPAVRQFLLSE